MPIRTIDCLFGFKKGIERNSRTESGAVRQFLEVAQ